MKYKFNYYRNRGDDEKTLEIEADNDQQAVLKLYDKVGIMEFGCIREDGHFFTDEKYPRQRETIMQGC
jgi:ribosomal protein S18 acetylase RimI-like enzyme